MFIYILDESLKVLHSFTSPSNTGHYLLESHIFEPYIITMGDTFTAHSMNLMVQNGKNQSPLSKSTALSWPGAGAFTISK